MKKRILSLALAVALLFALLPATAQAVQTGAVGENITWTFDETTGTLTVQGTGTLAVETGSPWEELHIKHLVIGEGITEIGYDVFCGQTSLTSVALPASLKTIGGSAFAGCEALEEIDIPAGVTVIGAYAFGDCASLKKVTFQEGLREIGYDAFGNAALEEVSIPASVTSIEDAAFSCSTLKSIHVDPANQSYASQDGVLYSAGLEELLFCPAGITGALHIPECCTQLDYRALDYAVGLTDLYIPAGTVILSEEEVDIYLAEWFFRTYNLQNIWFAEGHPEHITMDGVVYNQERRWTSRDENGEPYENVTPAGTVLQYVPNARSGCFEIPEGVTTIAPWSLYKTNITSLKMPTTLSSMAGYGNFEEMEHLTHILFTGEKPETTPDFYPIYLQNVTVYYPAWLESWADPTIHEEYEGANVTYIPYDQDKVPLLPGQSGTPFTDVPTDIWYMEPVLWAVEQGITEGMGDGSFGSELNCNRAQIVTFLWRAMGRPQPAPTECPFTDVPDDKWYTAPVLWAVENGITEGMGDGTFGVGTACNRAQVVTFLWRAAECPEPTVKESPFTDVDVDSWYGKAVLWAVEKGITKGMGDGTFGVSRICNRAQVVTFLYRAFAQ